MAECPVWIGDSAIGMVDAAYSKYSGFATDAYLTTKMAVQDLQQFTITPLNYAASYNLAQALAGYVRPLRPGAPDVDIDLPHFAPAEIAAEVFTEPPTDTTQKPVIVMPAPPDETLPVAPGDAPALSSPTMPSAPEIEFPDEPDLVSIVIPTAPVLNLPTFQGVRPDSDIPLPAEVFGFTPQQYSSALLDKVQGRIGSMLDGGTGLPAAIAQALRDRAFAAVDAEELRVRQEVYEEYAARGFDEPSGILNRRLAQARQQATNQRSALSRDIAIQDEQIAVENLRFAVTQGVVLESTLIQAWHDYMLLGLQVAQAVQQLQIDIFNGRVTLLNAQYQGYLADAQVYEAELRGELARLEVFKAEIDAERLKGEINQQKVALYEQRVRALLAKVQVYQAQVEGVKAEVDANTAVIEGFRARVQAYGEEVKARTTIWDGYRARVDGELSKVRIYEVAENAYATRVRAWSEIGQQKIARRASNISGEDLRLRQWQAQLGAALDQVRAQLQVYGAEVDLYRADASIEATASEANNRQFSLAMEQERSKVQFALQKAQIDISQVVQISGLLLEKVKSIASVGAQLTGSSMSAVQFSARVSSDRNQSQSCGTSFNYSGQIES